MRYRVRANSYSHSAAIGSLIAETMMNRGFGEDSESMRAMMYTIYRRLLLFCNFCASGITISFLCNSIKPQSCNSFSVLEILSRVSSKQRARSSIFTLKIFSPCGFSQCDRKKRLILLFKSGVGSSHKRA